MNLGSIVNTHSSAGVCPVRRSYLPGCNVAALSEIPSSPPATTAGIACNYAGGQDDSLVRAAQSGDRAAFGLLYARYSRMVHGILLARVPFSDVDDLVQDVFVQALP